MTGQVFAVNYFLALALAAAWAGEPISPLPDAGMNIDPARTELGRLLFHDRRLSEDNTVSCSSCHDLSRGGDDGRTVSTGVGGAQGQLNAPTVYNAVFNFRQFWNGRSANLEEQITGPIEAKHEMASSWPKIIEKLKQDSQFKSAFESTYRDGITRTNLIDAIAHFEKTLITPNARFDRFLKGDEKALSDLEKKGYSAFKSYGCIACHQGQNVGGNMYSSMGVMGNYFSDRKTPLKSADLGRFHVTGLPQDKHVFRVPSLRNVELTAPYFHDGSTQKLEDAVKLMARYQLGRTISSQDITAITAFLKTLTGELPPLKGHQPASVQPLGSP